MAERLLRKGKCSICSQRRLDSVEARQLPGKWKGGVWRIQLERPPKRQYQQLTASVQQPPGRSQSLWGCRPPCSLSLAETPRLADQPAWGEGKTITQARDFAILAASPQVGTLSAPRTHCEVLNKLLATHV